MSEMRSVISLMATSAPPTYFGKYASEKMRIFFMIFPEQRLECNPQALVLPSSQALPILKCRLLIACDFPHAREAFVFLSRKVARAPGWYRRGDCRGQIRRRRLFLRSTRGHSRYHPRV